MTEAQERLKLRVLTESYGRREYGEMCAGRGNGSDGF